MVLQRSPTSSARAAGWGRHLACRKLVVRRPRASGRLLWALWLASVMALVPAFAYGQSASLPANPAPIVAPQYDHPVWSPDGKLLAMSGADGEGVFVADLTRGTIRRVSAARGSGYALNWSADSRHLAFKLLIHFDDGRFPLQQPVVFDVADHTLKALTPPVARAGVPSFSADGKLAWTLDTELYVRLADGRTETYSLDHYANLTPISPNGTKVAFNNRDHSICVLDLATRKHKTLTPEGLNCFEPRWSADSSRLLASTLNGKIISIHVDGASAWELAEGSSPAWLPDSRTIVYTRSTRQEGVRLIGSDLVRISFDGGNQTLLTSQPDRLETSAAVAPDGSRIAYLDLADGRLYQAGLAGTEPAGGALDADESAGGASDLLGPAALLVNSEAPPDDLLATATLVPDSEPGKFSASSTITAAGQVWLRRSCPYVHQVYDTADSFNGHWACGATSAIMAIQYYETMPAWNMTCSWPYSHVSAFGQYVSAIYTFNGYTYNIGSPDPNGNLGYGGYGYIVRNNWADTKGYMRDYFRNHGLGSDVDWSPTWAKLQTEINADRPFVVLNDLTSAGHYITAVGYFEGQYTAIFNDPYGNKNTKNYPSYDGAGVFYDWPGYHNGYKNLNTVYCFIYCRGGSPPTISQQPVDRAVANGATTTFTVGAEGLGPFSYQWRKNGISISDGGHYAGTTTATLTVSSIDNGDVAGYMCVVSNSYGTVYSREARLRINSPDFDNDQDVDSEDFGLMQSCLGGAVYALPECLNTDLDGDGDVDALDVGRFLNCFAGAGVPPPAGCIE